MFQGFNIAKEVPHTHIHYFVKMAKNKTPASGREVERLISFFRTYPRSDEPAIRWRKNMRRVVTIMELSSAIMTVVQEVGYSGEFPTICRDKKYLLDVWLSNNPDILDIIRKSFATYRYKDKEVRADPSASISENPFKTASNIAARPHPQP